MSRHKSCIQQFLKLLNSIKNNFQQTITQMVAVLILEVEMDVMVFVNFKHNIHNIQKAVLRIKSLLDYCCTCVCVVTVNTLLRSKSVNKSPHFDL